MSETNQTYPPGSWVPHKRATWPFRFAILCEATRFPEWVGLKRDERGAPIFAYRWAPAGTKVKIVMVSRFGDVGITDDLTAEFGYLARVGLEKLEPAGE